MIIKSAIVLCAGRGKRLQPYTDETPKPLLKVSGVPTLDFILKSLKNAGVLNVCLVTHYLSEQIEAYAASQAYFDSQHIMCAKQHKLAGTADAAMAAITAKPEWFDESFILTASDYLLGEDFYTNQIQHFAKHDCAIGISLKSIPEAELALRSSVSFDSNGLIDAVVEKPAAGAAPSRMSANLIFILPANIKTYIEQVAPSARGEKEVQSAVNAHIAAHGPACGLEQAAPSEWTPDLASST
jgi:NDP-sugar pyrophosphorylase family protein